MRFGVRGFTLLELMIVVAIIGVLAALSVDAMSKLAAASGPQNALNDLVAQLSAARLRALERQTNVWVIVYPTFSKPTKSATGGHGAYFLYEDRRLQFGRASCTLPVCFSSFDPTGATPTIGTRAADGDRLLDATYFDDVSGGHTRVLSDAQLTGVTMPPPFTGLTPHGCSFCSGGPAPRGAIVFRPDGSARLISGDGSVVSGARTATLAVGEATLTRRYVVSLSLTTGFVGVHTP